MTSWADGKGQFQALDDAQAGTGAKLAGQHDVTAEERRGYNTELNDYRYQAGTQLVNATGGRINQVTEDMNSAYRIGQAADDANWGGKQEYLKAAQQQPLGDLQDPAARLKALSFITQDKPLKDGEKDTDITPDKSACSGASVVGAAFLAEGPDGLRKVMKAIEAQDPTGGSTGKHASPEYKALKAKLAKDPDSLTVADIQALQQTTTEVLGKQQANDPTIVSEGETGIQKKTLDNFMSRSPQLAKMFKDNGMQIEGIDNDGALDDNAQTSMDHWVVRIKGPDGKEAIYDPNARRGGQVIDFQEGVDHYTRAREDNMIVGQP